MAQTTKFTPEDAENPKEPGSAFVPWGPESAAAIARRVKQLWDTNPEYQRRQLRNPCRLCHDPDRERFDRLILIGAANLRISREMGGRKYTGLQILKHSDRHLVPLIECEIKPSLDVLMAVPYPQDGTVQERGVWFLSQLAGVRECALRSGQLNVAVTCLREMRTVDKEMLSQPRDGEKGGARPAGTNQTPEDGREAATTPTLPELVKTSPMIERVLAHARSHRSDDREGEDGEE
jgi:hypothetical protein